MDIEITTPINITLDVIEMDEHIPSINFNVIVHVNKFMYALEINSSLWIECECIDEFIKNIKGGNIAHLKDMKGSFELILNSSLGWFEWSSSKEDLDGYVTSSKGREKLTDEAKSTIYEAFCSFPKWW
ncbi:hypothetical protein [Morganella morganii]|uniref:hypothetical protein n=1 Tax=Morganella morganii TaxID=582 RepID=UPI0032DB8D8E